MRYFFSCTINWGKALKTILPISRNRIRISEIIFIKTIDISHTSTRQIGRGPFILQIGTAHYFSKGLPNSNFDVKVTILILTSMLVI